MAFDYFGLWGRREMQAVRKIECVGGVAFHKGYDTYQ